MPNEKLRRKDDERWDRVEKSLGLIRQDLNGERGNPKNIGLKGMFAKHIAVMEVRVSGLERWRTWTLTILGGIVAGLVVWLVRNGGI